MKLVTNRIVSPLFWEDDYIEELTTEHKLLFLYLITNKLTTACGVYQIKIKRVCTETGLDKERVIKLLERFDKDNRILYIDGWVAIKNFVKHQPKNKTNRNKIERLRLALPDSLVEKLISRGWESEIFNWDEPKEESSPMKRGAKFTAENFNGEEYVKTMLSSKQKHIRIIAWYWMRKGIIPPSYKAAQKMITRDLRDASNLAGYSDDEVQAAIKWQSFNCMDLKDGKPYNWNLGTVFKSIDNIIARYRAYLAKNK